MDVTQLKQFCRSFPTVTEEESGHPANVLSYKVGGKLFAYFKTSEPERWRFSLRVTPARFLELTDQPGVKPARYMHRFHWVTVVDVNLFDDEYLKELVNWSFSKAVSRLSKRAQAEIGYADDV